MGLNRVRIDSIKELNKKKTVDELTKENEALREQVSELDTLLTSTQMALCDVYEMLVGGEL